MIAAEAFRPMRAFCRRFSLAELPKSGWLPGVSVPGSPKFHRAAFMRRRPEPAVANRLPAPFASGINFFPAWKVEYA